MKQIKWVFLFMAFAAVISMMLVGVAIAENNTLGILGSILLVCLVMGSGFSLKKRMREKGLLD